MLECMIAMLVVSVLLICRDMAKTVFSVFRKSAATLAYDTHPQKERIEKYAASFQNLANVFYGMPYRKDYLTNGEMEALMDEARQKHCQNCKWYLTCWQQQYLQTHQRFYHYLRTAEEGVSQKVEKAKLDFTGNCINMGRLTQELSQLIRRERQNLIWNNKLIENRLAVAEQLSEMAQIMNLLSRELFELQEASPSFKEEMAKRLRRKRIFVKNIWKLEQQDGRQQVFMSLRTKGGTCLPVSEAAVVLSSLCGCNMVAKKEGKSVINGELATIRFVEDVNFKVLHGVAKVTREKETVSGDNYGCSMEENGRFFLCLSDGMGSGLEACKESEAVVELLEQFMDAGFSDVTSAKMVNSALVLQGKNERFSTVDICAIDLYSGMGHFLKAGAATTFIRRNNWVEAISSTSLALGMVQQIDFESTTRKLYDGDILIMVTDGVLDALPQDRAEEVMKEIILQIPDSAPKEMGRGILQRVLGYSEFRAADDMTVLVAGIWKK